MESQWTAWIIIQDHKRKRSNLNTYLKEWIKVEFIMSESCSRAESNGNKTFRDNLARVEDWDESSVLISRGSNLTRSLYGLALFETCYVLPLGTCPPHMNQVPLVALNRRQAGPILKNDSCIWEDLIYNDYVDTRISAIRATVDTPREGGSAETLQEVLVSTADHPLCGCQCFNTTP